MLAQIEAINSAVNGVVWGPIMLVLLVGTGIYLTFRTRGLQARRFGFILRNTIGTLFSKDKKKSGSQHNLTPFQAVSTALARHGGYRQHCRRHRRHLCRRSRRGVLDVGFRLLWHDDQVR